MNSTSTHASILLAKVPTLDREVLLRAQDLRKYYRLGSAFGSRPGGPKGSLRAVDGVELEIRRGETLALVGESGCGKSTLARMICGVVEPSVGSVDFDGVNLGELSAKRLRSIRRNFQMVLQDPYSSLNPRMRVRELVAEPLRIHHYGGSKDIHVAVDDVLTSVGLSPELRERFPHDLSGGQRQRVAIARAIVLRPSLLVADEPTSALDVSIQAQIVNLLEDLKAQYHLTCLVVSHDLAVVRHMADRIAVMYMGKIVEIGPADDVFSRPQHPYSVALVNAALLHLGSSGDAQILQGEVPSPVNPPSGCRFRTRCTISESLCITDEPVLGTARNSASAVACHFPGTVQLDVESSSNRSDPR